MNIEELKTNEMYSNFGKNIFNLLEDERLSEDSRKEIKNVSVSKDKKLSQRALQEIAKVVTDWAMSCGATHFSHWFQPLTGNTAEKQNTFLSLDKGKPISSLSVEDIIQGEPDASSFPHGGSRSTFEARGYTYWDLTSPMFLLERGDIKNLCIPTGFISYTGDALDIKTPLLRSIDRLNSEATKFLNLVGLKDVNSINVNCGAEQEYFLIDRKYYEKRPDLVMTGKTLFGSVPPKNQQLSDHYFGAIEDRILYFMQDLDEELFKLGIASKTRHNEVAPGQYEMAPIFTEANVATDNNQLVRLMIRKIANEHGLVALLHEKPFFGINGSGKHLNWSISTDTGINLFKPDRNNLFLAMVSVVVAAIDRHADLIRLGIATPGNDFRLGANEAPPSILSVYLGETLDKIYKSIIDGKEFGSMDKSKEIDIGAEQLARLLKDSTDRNRTSPFAFTGNKFELRAVGSSSAIGFPLTMLNAAVTDVLVEANAYLQEKVKSGVKGDKALIDLTKKLINGSINRVFNGDGYSSEWVAEAKSRGLSNLKTSADALDVFKDETKTACLSNLGILSKSEIDTNYNVISENYNLIRTIEFETLITMVDQYVIPAAFDYKRQLVTLINDCTKSTFVEGELLSELGNYIEDVYSHTKELKLQMESLPNENGERAKFIAYKLMPISDKISRVADKIESIVPNTLWELPKSYEMLFLH